MTVQNQIPFLYKVAFYYTNDTLLADDLVQETIYKALKYEEQFANTHNTREVLSVILKNIFIYHYNRQPEYFDKIVYNYEDQKNEVVETDDPRKEIENINIAISDLPSYLKNPYLLIF